MIVKDSCFRQALKAVTADWFISLYWNKTKLQKAYFLSLAKMEWLKCLPKMNINDEFELLDVLNKTLMCERFTKNIKCLP